MNDSPPPAEKRRKKPWLRRFAIAAGGIVVLLAALIVLLPDIASWQVRSQLEALGARSVEVDDLSINPVTGEVSFGRFRSVGPDGAVLSSGPAHLRVDLADLAQRQVTVTALSIADANVHVRYADDGRWSIAGLPMTFGASEPSPPSDNPWQLVADNVSVDGSKIALTLGKTTYPAVIDRLRIGSVTTLAPDRPATIDLNGSTGGGTLSIRGTATPFLKAPKAIFDIDVRKLAVGTYKPLLAAGRIKDIEGNATLKGKIVVSAGSGEDVAASYDGDLALTGGRAESRLFRARATSLTWSGEMDFRFGKGAAVLPSVRVRGKATSDGLELVNKASQMALSSKTALFDMSESGIRVQPDVGGKGASQIVGKLATRFSAAYFVQPESGLRVAAGRLSSIGNATLLLPPGTADLSGRLSGTMDASDLKGEMKTAGVDNLEAKSLRLAYNDLDLGFTADGAIQARTVADLATDGFAMSIPASGVKATADAISGKGTQLAFDRSAGGELGMQIGGPLEAVRIHAEAVNASWTADQKAFSWSGRIAVGGNASGKSNWKVDGTLESHDVGLSLREPSVQVSVAQSSWTGSAGATSSPGSLKADGNARLDRMTLNLKGATPMAATLGGVQASAIDVAGDTARVGRLSIMRFDARPAAKSSALPRAALRSLVIKNLATTRGTRFEVGDLRGTGGMLRLTRGNDGKLALPREGDAKASETDDSRRDATFRIGNAVLADTRLAFVDRTIDPPFEIETSHFQLAVSNFDTAKPDTNARIDMLVRLDKYGRLDVGGTAKPNFRKLSGNVDIAFKSLELFKFNPYIEPVIKYSIRQGRADGNIAVDLKKDRLDAMSHLKISKLQVRPLNGAKGGSATGTRPKKPAPSATDPNPPVASSSSAPPIETAIALLQNDEGIINLSIPISGSLKDPHFDLSNTIAQAVGNALKDTLLSAVRMAFPLGIVFSAADSRIAIEPLPFAPGTAALTPGLLARVAEVGRFLRKKGDASPSLCGYATPADIEALKAKDAKADAKAAESAAVGLARRRADAVRDRLIKNEEIAPERLFTCAPEIDRTPGDKPRVEVNL